MDEDKIERAASDLYNDLADSCEQSGLPYNVIVQAIGALLLGMRDAGEETIQ